MTRLTRAKRVRAYPAAVTTVGATSPGGGPGNTANHADPNNAYLAAMAA